MKKNGLISLIAIAALSLILLVGCGAARVDEQLDRAEDALENKIDTVENNLENAVETMLQSPAATTAPAAAAPSPTSAPSVVSPTLTKEEAEAIALEHAGFTTDQVQYLHTEYEIDDGRPQYEVSFHQNRWEYDYEIDADTGAIISFEKDD